MSAAAAAGATSSRRVDPRRFLSREQLERFRARSTWRGAALVLHCWGVIALAMAAAALAPGWPLKALATLVAIPVIGSRQLGLAILMHEGAHGGLARSERLNLALSQWLCAYPVLAETLRYRRYHLGHHAHAQTERDPDLPLSAPFPTTRASLRRKLVRDLTGQTGLKQRRAQFRAAWGRADAPLRRRLASFGANLGRPLLVNALLFAALAASGRWWLYPLLWVVPLLTWYQAVTRLRNIAEHAVLPDSGRDPLRVARTTRAGWIERAFLAPYWVNFHAEHHLWLYIPCYRLKGLHEALARSGAVGSLEVQPGYAQVLRLATARA